MLNYFYAKEKKYHSKKSGNDKYVTYLHMGRGKKWTTKIKKIHGLI